MWGCQAARISCIQEGITATGNPDVIKPDGTTSENEKQAVTELLYQYFEKNKATVPELANVTRDNLMVKTVLERIDVSRTVDPNNYQIVYEVVDKVYTLYLEFNPETEIVQPDTREIVNAVNLVNVSWNVGMGLTPAFTATVDEADQDKYEVYLEQWIGSDDKSITSEESFNSEISEDEKITTFEEGVTYYYSVWVKAKEGYAISEEASVYLDGRPADNGYTLANNDEPKRPDGSFLSGTFNSLFVMEIKAGETPIDSFTYEINGESVTITGYTGSEGNVTIPSEIEGKPVTAIGERAFSHNNTLTSVAIPDSVTSIGVKAFYNCKSLSSVTFAEGKPTFFHWGLCVLHDMVFDEH